MKLFGGSDGYDDDTKDISSIQIDKDYARRFEHNKKREDLQRLEELKKQGVVEYSDEEESSDEELPVEDLHSNLKFADALIKLKNKDPILMSKDAKFFDQEDEDEDEDDDSDDEVKVKVKGKGKVKEKPMYVKDVTAKQLLENGPDFDEMEDKGPRSKTYNEEQRALREAAIEALKATPDGGDGDIFIEKVPETNNPDGDDGDEFNNRLGEYFSSEDEGSKFLKKFFVEKLYLKKDDGGKITLDDNEVGISSDEEEIEKQEEFERKINFRYEEDAGDRVLGHSRIIEGSVRNKPNARKEQRKRKEERIAQAQFERNEELKHLKNLKKKETKEKLKKIWETSGISKSKEFGLDEEDLEAPFDEKEYDEKMKKLFNDDYYNSSDEDPEFGSDKDEDGEYKKPDFDKEDELLGLEKGWEKDLESNDGFVALNKKRSSKIAGSDLAEEVIKQELEEYYKLDYEDTIGDLKTRFKYRPVNANNFGLNVKDVLEIDDKDLNQAVPLKKIAPYSEKEWEVGYSKIQKLKSEKRGFQEGDKKSKSKPKSKSSNEAETSTAKVSEGNDGTKISRKAKRKQNQSEYKLGPERLIAYEKIPSQHKNKKRKH